VVMSDSTDATNTPSDTRQPTAVNTKNAIEAKAIFSSLVFTKESSEMILTTDDKPRNENRMKSSSSFIGHASLFFLMPMGV